MLEMLGLSEIIDYRINPDLSGFQKWYLGDIDKMLKAGGSIDMIHVDLKLNTCKCHPKY